MENFFLAHYSIAPAIFYGLLTVICWFMIRTIKKIDQNQSKLFELYGDLDRRLSKLQGAHDTFVRFGGHAE